MLASREIQSFFASFASRRPRDYHDGALWAALNGDYATAARVALAGCLIFPTHLRLVGSLEPFVSNWRAALGPRSWDRNKVLLVRFPFATPSGAEQALDLLKGSTIASGLCLIKGTLTSGWKVALTSDDESEEELIPLISNSPSLDGVRILTCCPPRQTWIDALRRFNESPRTLLDWLSASRAVPDDILPHRRMVADGLREKEALSETENWESFYEMLWPVFLSTLGDSRVESRMIAGPEWDARTPNRWDDLVKVVGGDLVPLLPFPRRQRTHVMADVRLRWRRSMLGLDSRSEPTTFRDSTNRKLEQELAVASQDSLVLCEPGLGASHYIYRDQETRSRGFSTVRIPEAKILLDRRRPYQSTFIISDRDRRIIPALSFGVVSKSDVRNVVHHREVAFIDDHFNSFNICHFIVDKLPRILRIGKMHCDRVLVIQPTNYVVDALHMLGVEPIVVPEGVSEICVETLWFSTSSTSDFQHPGHNCDGYFLEAINTIKQRISSATVEGQWKHRILIDRQGAKGRRVRNWEEVVDLLQSHGFLPYRLEEMSFAEQVELFVDANVVVGVHGAGLTNICFSKPGTAVIEILPPFSATSDYWKIASALGHRYRSLIADDLELDQPDYSNYRHGGRWANQRDVMIPMSGLRECLDQLLEERK